MNNDKISFEEALKRCDEISAEILSGSLDLNECIKKYDEAINCIKTAEKLLEEAKNEFDNINPVKEF